MGVIKVHSDFNPFQGPAVLLFCTNKLEGTFLFPGVHSSDKEKIVFPFYRWGNKKWNKLTRVTSKSERDFLSLSGPWLKQETAHFIYTQCSATLLLLCLCLHCNHETKVQKAILIKNIIYPLEVFPF